MTEPVVLNAVQQRILGALLEKQITVPATYPLTRNALRSACNQSSSRDPVVDYDDETLETALKGLRDAELIKTVWVGSGQRTVKYHQRLTDALELADDERAVLTVLLLRGPQTPGELKARTDRLQHFDDRGQVEEVLARLAARPTPVVNQLERRAGQQDPRWAHLLGPRFETAATPSVDAEQVIADGADARDERVRTTYTAVADDYVKVLKDELSELSFERWLIRRVADEARGPVLDAGCGPGHVAALLTEFGAHASGIDLTPAMIEQARSRFPGIDYQVGDLRRLLKPPAASGWAAVLGWYSLIHLSSTELRDAVAGMARVLAPGGILLLALHAGSEVVTMTEWFGHDVDLGFVLHEPEEVTALVAETGLVDVEWYRRGPHTWRGETTNRLYVLARKPR